MATVPGAWGREQDGQEEHRGRVGSQTILYNMTVMDTCHIHLSKSLECTAPRGTLGHTMALSDADDVHVCQWQEMYPLVGASVVGEAVCVSSGGKWEALYFLLSFAENLKVF